MISFGVKYNNSSFCPCKDKEITTHKQQVGVLGKVICKNCNYCCFTGNGIVNTVQVVINGCGVYMYKDGVYITGQNIQATRYYIKYPIIKSPIDLTTIFAKVEKLLILL